MISLRIPEIYWYSFLFSKWNNIEGINLQKRRKRTQYSSCCSEQRALREEAAQEMERRATAARAGSGDAMLPADNLIDAVAAGENLETMLKAGQACHWGYEDIPSWGLYRFKFDHVAITGPVIEPPTHNPAGSAKPVKDVETLKAEREESARQKMEEVLERLKADATKLPEAERKKAAHELRMLSSDKEAIGKVLSEMGKDLDSIPKNDRSEVKSKLREEAWQPTRDAIGVSSGDRLAFVPKRSVHLCVHLAAKSSSNCTICSAITYGRVLL